MCGIDKCNSARNRLGFLPVQACEEKNLEQSFQNAEFRRRGMSFRAYVHPPDAMEAVARRQGMHTDVRYRGRIWQIVALAR